MLHLWHISVSCVPGLAQNSDTILDNFQTSSLNHQPKTTILTDKYLTVTNWQEYIDFS